MRSVGPCANSDHVEPESCEAWARFRHGETHLWSMIMLVRPEGALQTSQYGVPPVTAKFVAISKKPERGTCPESMVALAIGEPVGEANSGEGTDSLLA